MTLAYDIDASEPPSSVLPASKIARCLVHDKGGIEIDVGQSTGQMLEPRPTQSEKPQALSIRKRFLVFKRDKYRCRICKATGVELEVDHIVPLAAGGSDALDNLQTLCFRCNRGKRDSIQ